MSSDPLFLLQCRQARRLFANARGLTDFRCVQANQSDIDLLITAPDAWLEGRNRFEVLDELWGLLARADGSLDLLLYSERECEERRQWRTHVIGRAFPPLPGKMTPLHSDHFNHQGA